MDKIQLGKNKKSFSLYFNNGEIWCEHLDSLCNERDLVIEKFKEDVITIARPSTSAYIVIDFDETIVDEALLTYIVDTLNSLNKSLRKVAMVGLSFKMKRHVKKLKANYEIKCIDDFEKAKEWLV
ncbi:MAG: hypothetical protein EOM40_05970 [Clostridia bacterium]|nr:hypothetical protein [Clostridia bacterium]